MSACADKHRYPDKGTAFFALRQRLHDPQRRVTFLRVYRCPHCRGWHLTHREKHQRRAPQPSLKPRPRPRRRKRRRGNDLGLNFYDS